MSIDLINNGNDTHINLSTEGTPRVEIIDSGHSIVDLIEKDGYSLIELMRSDIVKLSDLVDVGDDVSYAPDGTYLRKVGSIWNYVTPEQMAANGTQLGFVKAGNNIVIDPDGTIHSTSSGGGGDMPEPPQDGSLYARQFLPGYPEGDWVDLSPYYANKADLDYMGYVPINQINPALDNVLFYSTYTDLPVPGNTEKIYIVRDEDTIYRWDGSTYVAIGGGASDDYVLKQGDSMTGNLAFTSPTETSHIPALIYSRFDQTQFARIAADKDNGKILFDLYNPSAQSVANQVSINMDGTVTINGDQNIVWHYGTLPMEFRTDSSTGNQYFYMPYPLAVDGEVSAYSDVYPAAAPGVQTFLELTDTPSTYTDFANFLVRVKQDETGLEFIDPTDVGIPDAPSDTTFYGRKDATWVNPAIADISGLQLELDSKFDVSGGHITGAVYIDSNLGVSESINVGYNQNGNSAIAFNWTEATGPQGPVIFFDNVSNSFKVDITTAEEEYTIWHEGNYPYTDWFELYTDSVSGEKSLHVLVPLWSESEISAYASASPGAAPPGATTFLELTDTPSTYVDNDGKVPVVDEANGQLIFDSIYTESEFISTSAGTADAGKPIVLDENGRIDVSMLETSTFYYVGPWDPSAGVEYPDPSAEEHGAFWVVDVISAPNSGSDYIFQAGDLAGKTITVGDFMVWGSGGWGIMAGEMNPILYYKLDGSQAITGSFAGGGQQFKNAADGTDATDLITLGQANAAYSPQDHNHDTRYVNVDGDTMTGSLNVDGTMIRSNNIEINYDETTDIGFIDLHSNNGNDYDVRLYTNSGTAGSNGAGRLVVNATGINVNSDTVWHEGNFNPDGKVDVAGDTMTDRLTIQSEENNLILKPNNPIADDPLNNRPSIQFIDSDGTEVFYVGMHSADVGKAVIETPNTPLLINTSLNTFTSSTIIQQPDGNSGYFRVVAEDKPGGTPSGDIYAAEFGMGGSDDRTAAMFLWDENNGYNIARLEMNKSAELKLAKFTDGTLIDEWIVWHEGNLPFEVRNDGTGYYIYSPYPLSVDGEIAAFSDTMPESITGANTFLELTDTPTSYTDQAGLLVAVKSDETGLEFIPAPQTGIPEAPTDGNLYGRQMGAWELAAAIDHNHDDRYFTESEADGRYVNTTGDTMSGNLTIDHSDYRSFTIKRGIVSSELSAGTNFGQIVARDNDDGSVRALKIYTDADRVVFRAVDGTDYEMLHTGNVDPSDYPLKDADEHITGEWEFVNGFLVGYSDAGNASKLRDNALYFLYNYDGVDFSDSKIGISEDDDGKFLYINHANESGGLINQAMWLYQGADTIKALDSVLTFGGNEVWHEGNDGAGSGLDADLLDGLQGDDYARYVASTDGTSDSVTRWWKIATITVNAQYGNKHIVLRHMQGGQTNGEIEAGEIHIGVKQQAILGEPPAIWARQWAYENVSMTFGYVIAQNDTSATVVDLYMLTSQPHYNTYYYLVSQNYHGNGFVEFYKGADNISTEPAGIVDIKKLDYMERRRAYYNADMNNMTLPGLYSCEASDADAPGYNYPPNPQAGMEHWEVLVQGPSTRLTQIATFAFNASGTMDQFMYVRNKHDSYWTEWTRIVTSDYGDDRYVNVAGDTMTNRLTIQSEEYNLILKPNGLIADDPLNNRPSIQMKDSDDAAVMYVGTDANYSTRNVIDTYGRELHIKMSGNRMYLDSPSGRAIALNTGVGNNCYIYGQGTDGGDGWYVGRGVNDTDDVFLHNYTSGKALISTASGVLTFDYDEIWNEGNLPIEVRDDGSGGKYIYSPYPLSVDGEIAAFSSTASSTNQSVGMIMMFHGKEAPEGWAICDGTNGTADLTSQFIINSSTGEYEVIYIERI